MEEAEALCRGALRDLEAELGETHDKALAALGVLGQLLMQQGRRPEAEEVAGRLRERRCGAGLC